MPDRATVFAGAMTWHAMLPGFSLEYLASAFSRESDSQITIVDVGGGLGHASKLLAQENPNVRCIVQDSLDVITQAKRDLPFSLGDRIAFQEHDFFQEQPVKGADVYLLRLVLHDWSDKYARMIIKALVPALHTGARVLVNDRVIPGYDEVSYLAERETRSIFHPRRKV